MYAFMLSKLALDSVGCEMASGSGAVIVVGSDGMFAGRGGIAVAFGGALNCARRRSRSSGRASENFLRPESRSGERLLERLLERDRERLLERELLRNLLRLRFLGGLADLSRSGSSSVREILTPSTESLTGGWLGTEETGTGTTGIGAIGSGVIEFDDFLRVANFHWKYFAS